MKKSTAFALFAAVTFGLLAQMLPASARAQQRPSIAEQMADAYGLGAFGQIQGIRFSFAAELPGIKLFRTWEWNPKTDTVFYTGKDKQGKPLKVTYQRSQLGGQSDVVRNVVDPAFINDQYWLLLPFHAVWDGGATVTDDGIQNLPSGSGSAERIVMKYPSGGYSPGDTWELYVSADKRIEEMVYRRGGLQKPGVVIAKWVGYKKAGPLLISTVHRGTADGKPVRVVISNVSVKLAGSKDWRKAQ